MLKAVQFTRGAALLWMLRGADLYVSEVAALKVEHLDSSRGNPHIVNDTGGKQLTSILSKPVLVTLDALLQGREGGPIFEGRDQGHISTRQIERLLDKAAERAGFKRRDRAR